jgi:carotenoid isomerooxygenase
MYLSYNVLFCSLQTLIHLISREDGKRKHTFTAEAFFYLHIINCFEERDHCVLDICCYRDPAMLDCMYIESLNVRKSR